MIEFLIGAVLLFCVLWLAVYSGTKAALRSFFQRDYYDLEDDAGRRNEES